MRSILFYISPNLGVLKAKENMEETCHLVNKVSHQASSHPFTRVLPAKQQEVGIWVVLQYLCSIRGLNNK